MVADDAPSGVAASAGWVADGQHGDDPGRALGGRVPLAAGSHLVPHGPGPAAASGRDGRGRHRPTGDPQKELIERAYHTAEALGLQVWCEDEAGPYQAIPQPGTSWQPEAQPAHRPHEYVRGGTAKLLTLFRPATGEVRAEPVEHATNAVLHPWLKRELEAVLAACPAPAAPPTGRRWADWDAFAATWGLDDRRPPLRILLIWDNLAGHRSVDLDRWLIEHGILALYTPLAGSWLNLAESVQRILVRRALDGHHPGTANQLMTWLAETVRGWNADPTPFEWGGKRAARRARARARRHAVGGSGACTRRALRRPRRTFPFAATSHLHAK